MKLDIEPGISRRAALKLIGGGAIAGAVAGSAVLKTSDYLDNLHERDPYVDIGKYRFGYPGLSLDRQEKLFSSLRSQRVFMTTSDPKEGEVAGHIEPKSGLPHVMVIKGEPDPNISLNIVELELNDKNYIAPIIQSEGYAWGCVYLGELEESTDFTVKQLGISSPNESDLSPLQFDTYSLIGDSFTMAVIKNIPELYLREENKDDIDITNDIPLSFDITLRESWTSVRLAEYSAIFSGEDGGSAPYPLLDREGRLTDYETVAFTKLTDLGMTLEEAHQGRDHKVHIQNQYFKEPKILGVGDRLQYTVETDNNMVKPGNSTRRAVSIFPDVLLQQLGMLEWHQLVERERTMRAISIRENLEQGFISPDDSYVKWFIQNELGGNDLIFPYVMLAKGS